MPELTEPRIGGRPPWPLNVLAGLPDNRLCEVRNRREGKGFIIEFPGTADIVQFLPEKFFKLNTINLGPFRDVETAALGAGPILNHIADPDRCSRTLEKAQELVKLSRRACFNHPAAVARTSRDGVASLLADVSGLKVPRTIRHRYQGRAELKKALEQGGLAYPLILRIAGDHGGISTLRISGPSKLSEAEKLNGFGKDIYATEFCDFASPDGRYRKFRLAVIGNELFLRHMIVGDQWLLHAERRGANTAEEEAAMLERFDTKIAPRIRPTVDAIAERLALDYLGIDCNIDDEGRLILFEANACMNIMANTQPSPNMWDRPISRIGRALMRLLAMPKKWRHPPALRGPQSLLAGTPVTA